MLPTSTAVLPRSLQPFGVGLLLLVGPACAMQQAEPTTSFRAAAPILAGGDAIDLGSHATTRCCDWDGDADLDLLVGGGDGRLWRFANVTKNASARFERGVEIVAGGRKRWGTGFTGVMLQELTGDGLPDLIVAHSDRQVAIHANVGSRAQPRFAEASVDVPVQQGCQGRFDLGDWDGDGLLDLVTGAFGGGVELHLNVGSDHAPEFAEAVPFHGIQVAYNAQPRLVDFDRDGALDLLLGVNWGTITLYRNLGTARAPELAAGQALCWSEDGRPISLREQNGDDTTPELADLDGDGVLDLLSGGHNGRLFVLRGVGAGDRVTTLRQVLTDGGDDAALHLERDTAARNAAFGALGALRADLATGLIQGQARERLSTQLAEIAVEHAGLLRRRRFDLERTPHAPMLAAQFWVVAKAASPDDVAGRERLADGLGFAGGHRRLLVDLGVILYDNDTATARQLALMHRLLRSLPRATWDVELISVADWLGPAHEDLPVRARTSINIFAMSLGVPENSFPADAPRPGITDVFLICLAHEIAHNMLDTVGRRQRPELFERKFEGLAFAAGDDVVFRSPKSLGIDVDATRAKFRSVGAWDGEPSSWAYAWRGYFAGRERFDRAYARGNVQFFLDAPQEAFATLANQYVTDSELMLEFSKLRWDAGHRSTVHQFLLFADYLSGGGDRVPFYVLPRGGDLRVSEATLQRDAQGRIVAVRTPDAQARFGYGEGTIVTTFERSEVGR